MKHLILLIPVFLLSGCATKKPTIVAMPRSVPGNVLAASGIESVRYSENIKAYPMGRYIEPNNGLVMHEGHTVYRVETTAKWNLHPNASIAVPRGPVVQLIDPARQPSPVTPEIIAEVNKQKSATLAVIEQGNRMNQALTNLAQSVVASRQIAEDTAQLKADVGTTKRRLELLEEQFRKRQSETFTTPTLPTKGADGW